MSTKSVGVWRSIAVVCVFMSARSADAQCQQWSRDFAPDGVDQSVRACVSFDDGFGAKLYVAGDFSRAGAIVAHNIARWNGSGWMSLGSGTNGEVRALCVFDDGSGAAIYAAGAFDHAGSVGARNIAKWNGSSWSPLAGGTNGGVYTMTVFDDGSGPALYAGGRFTTAGGSAANGVARWNGSSWSALGDGFDVGGNNSVDALAVFDDGSGPALYAGGIFSFSGTTPVRCIAKWNGASWNDVGGGVDAQNPAVEALRVFDDGSGPALYAAGGFTSAGGVGVNNVAKWDGSTWSPIGLAGDGNPDHYVRALEVYDEGAGPMLHAAGSFFGGVEVWSAGAWAVLGGGIVSTVPFQTVPVYSLRAFDDGSGAALFAGGEFTIAGGLSVNNIARWSSGGWQPLGTRHGLAGNVAAMSVFDDGSGPQLVVGGNFVTAGDHAAKHVARWNGAHWSTLGDGLDGPSYNGSTVSALCRFDDGTGPALFAGGSFTSAGAIGVNAIARWKSSAWSPLGSGLTSANTCYVTSMAVYHDGTGAALFVGGSFDTAGGLSAKRIAKWNGSTWSALGAGVASGVVNALAAYDDGTGAALYAGGSFNNVDGVPVHGIARWNGASWSDVGGGVTNGLGIVTALAVFDDGSGPALFAGGYFTAMGGTPANYVAKWNGAQWSDVGGGVDGPSSPNVRALAVMDDGTGPRLCIGGNFASAGGGIANNVARWNGAQWTTLSDGITGGDVSLSVTVRALCEFGSGPSGAANLFVGGVFTKADAQASLNIAEWVGCGHPGARTCNGDGTVAPCPCGNSGAAGHGCENSASTGGSVLDSSGWPSLAFDTLAIGASGELSSALSVLLQGDAEIAPTPFGDGLRCAGGHLKRLYTKHASGGSVSAPQLGDAPISVRSAALGDPIASGEQRVYQVYYRDPNSTFCPEPAGSTWNVSNGIRISWMP